MTERIVLAPASGEEGVAVVAALAARGFHGELRRSTAGWEIEIDVGPGEGTELLTDVALVLADCLAGRQAPSVRMRIGGRSFRLTPPPASTE